MALSPVVVHARRGRFKFQSSTWRSSAWDRGRSSKSHAKRATSKMTAMCSTTPLLVFLTRTNRRSLGDFAILRQSDHCAYCLLHLVNLPSASFHEHIMPS